MLVPFTAIKLCLSAAIWDLLHHELATVCCQDICSWRSVFSAVYVGQQLSEGGVFLQCFTNFYSLWNSRACSFFKRSTEGLLLKKDFLHWAILEPSEASRGWRLGLRLKSRSEVNLSYLWYFDASTSTSQTAVTVLILKSMNFISEQAGRSTFLDFTSKSYPKISIRQGGNLVLRV